MKKDSLRKTVFSNEDVFCLFLNVVEAVHALVFSDWTQFILNADQLVVLRDTVCTAHRTGLDLACIQADSDIRNRRIFSFTGTVGNDAGIARLLRHFDSVKGFCQRTDLVDLDQDRVRDALFNAFLQDCRVRNEQIVTDQLNLASQLVCQFLSAVPVSFA